MQVCIRRKAALHGLPYVGSEVVECELCVMFVVTVGLVRVAVVLVLLVVAVG